MPDSQKLDQIGTVGGRRRFLQTVGATGFFATVAGCLADDDDEADDADTDDEDDDGTDDTDQDDDDEAADFQLENLTISQTSVTVGELLESVSADVTNITGGDGTQDIELLIDDSGVDSTELSLDGFAQDSVTFRDIETAEYEPGDYVVAVASEDSSVETTVVFEEPTPLDDPLLSINEELVSTGTVELTGSLDSSFSFPIQNGEVTLAVPDRWNIGEESGTTFDELEENGSQSVSWELDIPGDAAGEYDLEATVAYEENGRESGDLEVSHTLTVYDEDGAQYFFSANDYDVGESPDDRFEPMAHVYAFEIEEDDDGNYLHIDGGDSERSSLRFTDANPALQAEFLVRMKGVDADSGDTFAYLRGTDEDDPGDGGGITMGRYDCYLNEDNYRLSEYVQGSWNGLASTSHVGVDVVYYMRGQMDGGRMRARMWPADENEPEDWDMEADAPTEDPGYAGLGHYAGEHSHVYEFSLGIGGEEAPSEPLE